MQILRSALCLQFFQPVVDGEAKQSFDAVSLSILVLSVAHKTKNLQDRYFTLLQACKLLIAEAIFKESNGETSPIFSLYELQWFVGLWNETQVQGISMSYKEELSIALMEATLSLAERHANLAEPYSNVCLEVGEITSKVLDWKTSTLHKQHPMLAEFVTTKYFHFVELIASNHVMSAGTNERL